MFLELEKRREGKEEEATLTGGRQHGFFLRQVREAVLHELKYPARVWFIKGRFF